MAEFLIDLYVNGKGTYENYNGGFTIELSEEMKNNMNLSIEATAENSSSKKGKTDFPNGYGKINPAFALLAYAQTEALNTTNNVLNKNPNGVWASTSASFEERLITEFYGYKIEFSDASNSYLFRGKKSYKKALNALQSGKTVIACTNSRQLHFGTFKGRPFIMTHYVILKMNNKKWE